ncbi:MAG: PilC/PilY family type IV pilus protein [Neisseria sp.]|nr:PilC/PilY family type IV pilus protein [Neisseria sp.]
MKLKTTAPKFMPKPICAMLGMLLAAPAAWAATYPNVPLALTGGQSSVKTNVLLFIDTSGSMRDPISSNSSEIRQVAAKNAAKQVIADNPNLRFGLATFNDNQTSGHSYPYIYGANIRVPIDDVADKDGITTAHKGNLDRAIDGLVFSGGTPTTSAYYELTRYFRGMSGAYPDAGGANRAITYTSPIEYRCQKNAIVFISDGQPQTSPWNIITTANRINLERTYSATYSNTYPNWTFYVPNPTRPLGAAYDEAGPFGHARTNLALADSSRAQQTLNGSTVYSCTINNTCTMYNELGLSHFAGIANNQDMMQGGEDKEGQSFDDEKFPNQTIQTYTIGFGENIPMLSHAATAGGGSYFTATSATQLQDALKNIFQSIPSLGAADFSAVAPTAVNNSNGQIAAAQTVSLNTANWSSQLRFYNVENNVVGTSYSLATYNPAGSTAVISTDSGAQALANSNTALSNTTFALGSSNPAQWQNLVQWLTRRGAEGSTGYRVREPDVDRYLGDVLGSSLTAMGLADKSGYTYGASNQEFLAVGANDGMAHIYRKTGAADNAYTDVFQYIPGLAKNQEGKTINERLQLTAAEGYGAQNPEAHQNLVNGPISWHETFASDNRSRIFLTGTLGEGGRAAYALNIGGVDSNNNPVGLDGSNWVANVPLWDTSSGQIGAAKNGVDGIIGHTFGEPFNGRIALDGSTAAKAAQYRADLRYATVLGSGFDPAPDNNGQYPAPSVFVLDSLGVNAGADANGRFLNPTASTQQGALLRQISVAGLADNIATNTPKGLTSPTGLDIDGDGLWDVAYAGDQNGNVYRFDFRAEQSQWNAEIIFKGNSSQPITAQPNVYRSTTSKRVTVLFGTGSELYSGDLTDTSLQRFYGIQDPLDDDPAVRNDLAVNNPLYPLTPDSPSLLEQTYQQTGSGDDARRTLTGQTTFNHQLYKGWYMNLTNNGAQEGERVVTMSEVGGTRRRGGSVVFTTRIFKPGETSNVPSCTAPSATSTSGFMIAVNAETGGRAPGLRFDKENQDWIGLYYPGSLSSPKLAGNNTYDQTIFGGSRSGRSFRLNSNPEIDSGCRNDAIQIGVGSSQTGASLMELHCPTNLAIRRISWREIF